MMAIRSVTLTHIATSALFVASLGCASRPTSHDDAQADMLFDLCLEQEARGDASDCWKVWQARFSDRASDGRKAYVAAKLTDAAPEPVAVKTPTPDPPEALEAPEAPEPEPRRTYPDRTARYDECYHRFEPTRAPMADIQKLGEMCGRPTGMLPMTEPTSGRLAHRSQITREVKLFADRCYRFFAVGDASIADLDTVIRRSSGEAVIYDTLMDPIPILDTKAPFCPDRSDTYRFEISAAEGSGSFAYQIWEGPRPEGRGPTVPTLCQNAPDYGPIEKGSVVVLGAHRRVDSKLNWAEEMVPFVGRTAVVTRLGGVDPSGCPIVRVDIDGGQFNWRVRAMRLVDRDEAADSCGRWPEEADYGPVVPETQVVLRRHRAVEGDRNWNVDMERFVGKTTRVTQLAGVDPAGCALVRVEVDTGRFAWRARDLDVLGGTVAGR